MPVDLTNLEALFSQALEVPPGPERSAYLERACEGDAELRRQVESLLAVHERADRFLESPTGSFRTTLPDLVGSSIGPYRLMEPIGEGGMGVVFVAEQAEPVRRRVALKVIKPGMDSRQVVARFEAERQALALMDHPNIARVFDGGATDSGSPYFVMELVRGLPITEYCDAEQLSIRDRLELFVLVCRAVQHAHQKGVIHRDLKPSNVLVTVIDGVAVPKVIDFGVAKATGASLTEQTLYTGFHQLVGTPLYMSPEQASLSGVDVDTRSDIYSLGVLLYELLTGTTPFDAETLRRAAFDEMRRIIREEDPPKPSTRLSTLGGTRKTVSAHRKSDARHLDRAIRGELDWIVMRALEKDRRRRYETARDFAADVVRHLNDQPVEACPPSAWYRFTKFLLRNRAVVIPVSVLTLLTVVGLSIGTAVIARGRAVALRELARVRAERRELAAGYFEAYEHMGDFGNLIRNGASDAEAFMDQRRKTNERAIAFQERLAAQLITDPEGRFEAARCYYQTGEELRSLGRLAPAEAGQRRAITLLTELIDGSPDRPEYREALQVSLSNLGLILAAAGRPREAEAALRRALDFTAERATLGPIPAGTMRFPGVAYSATAGLDALVRLVAKDRPQEAVELLRRSCAIWQDLALDDPQWQWHLPSLRFGLVQLLSQLGEFDQAAQVAEELVRRPLNDPEMLNNLAWVFATADTPPLRDPARAAALARAATERAPNRASNWNTLGVASYRTGDWRAAIEALEKAEALEPEKNLAFNGFFLAMARWQLGNRDEARRWFDRSTVWMDQNRPRDAELRRFRAEAVALLGMEESPKPESPDAPPSKQH